MALIAFNKTTAPVTIIGTPVVLPAASMLGDRGESVNVTAALQNLTTLEYTAIQMQMLSTFGTLGSLMYELEWTTVPQFATPGLNIQGIAQGSVEAGDGLDKVGKALNVRALDDSITILEDGIRVNPSWVYTRVNDAIDGHLSGAIKLYVDFNAGSDNNDGLSDVTIGTNGPVRTLTGLRNRIKGFHSMYGDGISYYVLIKPRVDDPVNGTRQPYFRPGSSFRVTNINESVSPVEVTVEKDSATEFDNSMTIFLQGGEGRAFAQFYPITPITDNKFSLNGTTGNSEVFNTDLSVTASILNIGFPKFGSAISIANVSSSTVGNLITTSIPHELETGDAVYIDGVYLADGTTRSGVNGNWVVSVVDSISFTIGLIAGTAAVPTQLETISGGPYLSGTGAVILIDNLDFNGIIGPREITVRGSGDFSDSTLDRIQCGGRIFRGSAGGINNISSLNTVAAFLNSFNLVTPVTSVFDSLTTPIQEADIVFKRVRRTSDNAVSSVARMGSDGLLVEMTTPLTVPSLTPGNPPINAGALSAGQEVVFEEPGVLVGRVNASAPLINLQFCGIAAVGTFQSRGGGIACSFCESLTPAAANGFSGRDNTLVNLSNILSISTNLGLGNAVPLAYPVGMSFLSRRSISISQGNSINASEFGITGVRAVRNILSMTATTPITVGTGGAHGLTTGMVVEITGTQGLFGADGKHRIRVTGTSSFQLDASSGSGSYVTSSANVFYRPQAGIGSLALTNVTNFVIGTGYTNFITMTGCSGAARALGRTAGATNRQRLRVTGNVSAISCSQSDVNLDGIEVSSFLLAPNAQTITLSNGAYVVDDIMGRDVTGNLVNTGEGTSGVPFALGNNAAVRWEPRLPQNGGALPPKASSSLLIRPVHLTRRPKLVIGTATGADPIVLTTHSSTAIAATNHNLAPTAIVNATNDSPIEITTNVPHGLTTGMDVKVSGVTGNFAANGTWVATVVSLTKFTLGGTTGNGDYINGGLIGPVVTIEGPISGTMTVLNGLTVCADLVTASTLALTGVSGTGFSYTGGGRLTGYEFDNQVPGDLSAQGLSTATTNFGVFYRTKYLGGQMPTAMSTAGNGSKVSKANNILFTSSGVINMSGPSVQGINPEFCFVGSEAANTQLAINFGHVLTTQNFPAGVGGIDDVTLSSNTRGSAIGVPQLIGIAQSSLMPRPQYTGAPGGLVQSLAYRPFVAGQVMNAMLDPDPIPSLTYPVQVAPGDSLYVPQDTGTYAHPGTVRNFFPSGTPVYKIGTVLVPKANGIATENSGDNLVVFTAQTPEAMVIP